MESNNNNNTAEILDLLAQAQAATLHGVNVKRIELLAEIKKAEQVHAVDDYSVGVTAVLQAHHPRSVHLRQLAQVFPDTALLRDALKALKEKGVIEETRNGVEKIYAITKA